MEPHEFIATPSSEREYFPMMLANGNDAILMNYTGSMASALTGHSHYEQHQGVPCAWYRISHSANMGRYGAYIEPVIQAGYQVIVHDEVCEPSHYRQQFSPETAILRTVTESWGVKLEIEAFLTDEGILVERYKVLKAPPTTELVFFTRSTNGRTGALCVPCQTSLKEKAQSCSAMKFDWNLDGIDGCGAMLIDRKGSIDKDMSYAIRYQKIRRGFSVTRFLFVRDQTDGSDWQNQCAKTAKLCRQQGYSGLKQQHIQRWKKYSNASRMVIPDNEMQYLYDLGVYSLRANQHPKTGAITCGMLPHLWGGGTICPYDASFAQQALLKSNRVDTGRKHLGFHAYRRNDARRFARKYSRNGAVYSGWTNCFGKHKGGNFANYVMHYKPIMSAFLVLDYYWQWKFQPVRELDIVNLRAMREILDFVIEHYLKDCGDHAVMRPCAAGNESEIEVQNDTFHSLIFARALACYAEMAEKLGYDQTEIYSEFAKKTYRGLESNYIRKGVLLPWRNAKYLAYPHFDYFIWNLPDGIPREGVYESLREAATPWGLDAIMPSERYRDWPWWAPRAAIALAHMGDARKSFRQLQKFPTHASVLGAIPEKIRLDGYAIGYWYNTPYAIFIWAMNDAFCHDGPGDSIRLLWGLDGEWKDASFKNIRLGDGILASGVIRDRKLCELNLKNTSNQPLERILDLNPFYKTPKLPKKIILDVGRTWRWRS